MDNKIEIATSKFNEGYNCAQSVLFSFCDDLGINKETALKIACGLGGGMGRNEQVCGAVTGGILVIGAKYGKYNQNDNNATEITYKKTRDLMNIFEKKHGTYICKNLLKGCDLKTEEGQNQFKDMKFKKNVCIPCVQSAVSIIEGLI
jgi:C_GCAxxG_C_C family probable redox protein